MRVVLDAGVNGADGIGRYSRCVTHGMAHSAPPDLHLITHHSPVTSRYSRVSGHELLDHAARARADLVHLLDYRIPITSSPHSGPGAAHRCWCWPAVTSRQTVRLRAARPRHWAPMES